MQINGGDMTNPLLSLAQWLESDTPVTGSRVPPGMLSAVATSPQAVGLMLVTNGYQEWKLPALLDMGNDVAVLDGDGRVRHGLPSVNTLVEPGEMLVFPAPQNVNAATTAQWQALATAMAHDYVLISGKKGAQTAQAAELYNFRPLTSVHMGQTVPWFVAGLNGTLPVAENEKRLRVAAPVRSVVLVAHANAGGNIWLNAEDGTQALNYPALKELLGTPAGTKWRLYGAALEPRPIVTGGRLPTRLSIIGCNAGRAEGFLILLRQLFNVDELIASRHFVGVVGSKPGGPRMQHFLLDLRVARPTRLNRTADVIAAINAMEHPDLDGAPVVLRPDTITLPDSLLHRQTPTARVVGDNKLVQHINAGPAVEYAFQVSAAIRDLEAGRFAPRYRYIAETLLQAPRRVANDPGTQASRIALAMADLKRQTPRQHDADFPVWSRWDDPDEASFVQTWDWRFAADGAGFTYHPVRHQYTIMLPATWLRPGDGARLLAAEAFAPQSGLNDQMEQVETGRQVIQSMPPVGSAAYNRCFVTIR